MVEVNGVMYPVKKPTADLLQKYPIKVFEIPDNKLLIISPNNPNIKGYFLPIFCYNIKFYEFLLKK